MDLKTLLGDELARPFSGVVRVDLADGSVYEFTNGWAERTWSVPWTPDTRFGIASGTKTFTALTVVSLFAEAAISPEDPVRSVLGSGLPLIDDRVTFEHLLSHRSGIGDYFDEDAIDDVSEFVPSIPVQHLVNTVDYLPMLDGLPMRSEPGEVFAYNNSGYVVLALAVERITGASFAEAVDARVCRPAGLGSTGFVRSDSPPPRTATGYLDAEGTRSNVFRLPLVGTGDGGMHTTTADVAALWRALGEGRIVPPEWFERMSTPWSFTASGANGYGWGCWLPTGTGEVELEGADAGVSFRSTWHRAAGRIVTVASNTGDGVWPVASRLAEVLSA